MALDMTTGHVLWSHQITTDDAFLGGCYGKTRTDNCPPTEGPGWDVPASPILAQLPDRVTGKLTRRLSFGPAAFGQTGILWGGAAYDDTVDYGLKVGGGLAAIVIPTGKRLWQVPIDTGAHYSQDAKVGHESPATTIPGVVFFGSADDTIVAASTTDGHVLWTYGTARDFDTVNTVPAYGGSMGSQGITVSAGAAYAG